MCTLLLAEAFLCAFVETGTFQPSMRCAVDVAVNAPDMCSNPALRSTDRCRGQCRCSDSMKIGLVVAGASRALSQEPQEGSKP